MTGTKNNRENNVMHRIGKNKGGIHVLGLDPARGYALIAHKGRERTPIIWGTVPAEDDVERLIDKVHELSGSHWIDHVVIECPSSPKVFPRKGQNKNQMLKIGRNVGMNYQKAKTLIMVLKRDYHVIARPPIKGGTKLSWVQIEAMTGLKCKGGDVNARDAFMIAWWGYRP